MAKKITELTDGGALQTGDILAGVRAGVTNKVVPGTAATRAVGLAATNVLQADQTEASTATATTVALGVATLRHLLTGTTTVTGFTGTAGVMYTCRANAAFILTHHATNLIITQTGANITTAAGDTFDVIMITGTTCRIVNFVRASGQAVAVNLTPATVAVTDTTDATSTTAAPLKSAGGLAVAKKAYFGGTALFGEKAVLTGKPLTLGDTLSGTIITPRQGYSYINVATSHATTRGILLLVFASGTTLEIITEIDNKAAGGYSVAVSGRDLVVTNTQGAEKTYWAACMTLARDDGSN